MKSILAVLSLIACLFYVHSKSNKGLAAAEVESYQPLRSSLKKSNLSLKETSKPQLGISQLVPSVLPIKSALRQNVEHEARHLYDVNEDPKSIEDHLRSEALAMGTADLNELTEIAINETSDPDERTISAYLLTLAGPIAQEALLKVFFAPTQAFNEPAPAHSLQEMKLLQEHSLRTMALEAIETNLQRTGQPLKVSGKTQDTYLNGLLKIVQLGEKMHRPMLKEFIDQNLKRENL